MHHVKMSLSKLSVSVHNKYTLNKSHMNMRVYVYLCEEAED